MSLSALPMVSDADVRSVITVGDAVEVVQRTYADFGQARLSLSRPAITRIGDGTRGFGLKGALLDRYGVAGVRVTPTHASGGNSWCLVLESESGRPLVAVEETWLHRLRTAASAAVAARLLARPDSRVLTLVGAGRIARFVPAAFAAAFELTEIRVVATSAGSAASFAAGQSVPGVTLTSGTDLDAAAPGSDVVVAITSARRPAVRPRHLLPGGTLIGLGGGAEIAAEVLTATADRFFVDDLGYARETGSVASWLGGGLSPDAVDGHLTGTLPAVAAGLLPGRVAPADRILAVVQGVAACDVALACLTMRRLGIA
ncbi:hypothetical protein [Actinacidiphila sp. ITFR-21]|uniref:hypothetical protein n=1 Tax=Actinacidiphila sp. ITFR-21 TaxID=3075199 RepID=UPI00288B94CF|nr:hypothetical protein [Streptomyces sp. ITFR-21]WNI18804.1 hypothetical protein RLT57_26935 [Streptomyces sp. ITFR-21]